MTRSRRRKRNRRHKAQVSKTQAKPVLGSRAQAKAARERNTTPDWEHSCEVCGCTPIVPATGMCGPCTFGEAATAGGNW